jgi:ferredoxin
VTIDADLCIGSSECIRIVPGAFRLDKVRGVSEPTDLAATADAGPIADAVRSCPTQAISVEDGDA